MAPAILSIEILPELKPQHRALSADWLEPVRHGNLLLMDYRVQPVPDDLTLWVAGMWTLDGDGDAAEWVEHSATPDGCVEIVRRTRGRSSWGREQPRCFATGLSEQPIQFRFTGDVRFAGIRLWPWAWHRLSGMPCASFADDWRAIDPGAPAAALLDAEDRTAALRDVFAHPPPPIVAAILAARAPADVAVATGLSPRQVQRWFGEHIGIAPQRYLRLLRFGGAMAAVQTSAETLALTAADRGYADQAHMARDFRALAGAPPSKTRDRANGPFL